MSLATLYRPPNRITDLVNFKEQGAEITCNPSFEIVAVDFTQRDNQFKAFTFLCRFAGRVDESDYLFRKCYARGCPHNLCPQVSQAIMIANRYLQRDYRKLQDAGVPVETRLFTLDDMVVKFDGAAGAHDPLRTIYDFIDIARQGEDIAIAMDFESVTGVEHFANYDNQQVFLMANFNISLAGDTHKYERCLACYPVDREKEERPQKLAVANERLKLLYAEFDRAAIRYEKRYFV